MLLRQGKGIFFIKQKGEVTKCLCKISYVFLGYNLVNITSMSPVHLHSTTEHTPLCAHNPKSTFLVFDPLDPPNPHSCFSALVPTMISYTGLRFCWFLCSVCAYFIPQM